ncbi:hypothetical protein [uncultured Sulfitobacter sp.]|uniref:hypothetical protein n=1 Tax=uncultured Sulfitobacter sp. TaxID=191468 RepID=UPI000C5B8A2B|nr:hypothetical protein [Sulfitobacter sp.]
MKIEEALYGKYRLVAGKLGEKFVARAFHNRSSNGRGVIAEVEGASSLEAISALKDALKARDNSRAQARRYIERLDFHVPTTEEFVEALRAVGPKPAEWDMLGAHARAGESGLNPLQIAKAGGYNTVSNANALYGKLGRKLEDHLAVTAPNASTRDGDVPTGILAIYEADPRGSDVMVWIMHPELREAVAAASPYKHK